MPVPYDLCDYTKFWIGRDYENQAERIAVNRLVKLVDSRQSFVDVGGGFGRLSAYLANYFAKGILVDPSVRNIKESEKYLKNYGNVSKLRGTLPSLPLNSNMFDLVLFVRVSHHLPNLTPAIKELERIAKPGGYLMFEIANKINLRSRIKAYLKGELNFTRKMKIEDRRSEKSRQEKKITFVNHHPEEVIRLLKKNNLSIIEILSVSNLRNKLIKRLLPLKVLLILEGVLQSPLAKIYAGPSIFILARKHACVNR